MQCFPAMHALLQVFLGTHTGVLSSVQLHSCVCLRHNVHVIWKQRQRPQECEYEYGCIACHCSHSKYMLHKSVTKSCASYPHRCTCP